MVALPFCVLCTNQEVGIPFNGRLIGVPFPGFTYIEWYGFHKLKDMKGREICHFICSLKRSKKANNALNGCKKVEEMF